MASGLGINPREQAPAQQENFIVTKAKEYLSAGKYQTALDLGNYRRGGGMKKVFGGMVVAGVMLLFSAGASAEQFVADSRITAVTVFPDSALVTRVARLQLSPGEHQIVLADIIPDIDQNSLRVSAQNADVRLYGAKVEVKYLEELPSPRVKELAERIQQLDDEAALVRGQAQVLADEKGYLDSIRMFSREQVPKDLATRTPLAKDLEENLKFLDAKLREHSAAVLDNSIKQRELGKKIDALRQELNQISGSGGKMKRSIIVDVGTQKNVSVELNVSYVARGANWEPLYDARADFEKSEVELVLYAVVQQKTGEDWAQVELSLSTAKPAIGGSMPYVEPWFLRPLQPVPSAPAMRVAKFAAQTMAFEEKSMDADIMVGAGAEPARTQVKEKGVAVVYTLAQKADCKSDGAQNKYQVISQKLKANFEYSAYPRSVLLAYLGSRVKNAPDLQLLGGGVNIFLAGDYVGSSAIENIGPGEEFDLYLGADENVKVKRQLVEKKVDETLIGGIPSPNRVTVFKYKLSAENYKGKRIALKLFESMPVSQDDRIKVKMGKVSLEPGVRDWKDRKGVWLWELGMEPKQKSEISYTYTVEHPRDVRVDGV